MAQSWRPASAEPVWHPASAEEISDYQPESAEPESVWQKAKEVGKRFIFGPDKKVIDETIKKISPEDAKYREEHGISGVVGLPEDDSLLPKRKTEPDTYWSGFANSLYNDFVRPQFGPTGFIGSSSISRVPRIDPSKVEAGITATKAARKTAGLDMPKGLPPVRQEPRTFYQGEGGVAEKGKTYPLDTAPANPRLGQTTQGFDKAGKELPVTVLPQETGSISEIPAIDAARRGTKIGEVPKFNPSHPMESLERVKSGSTMELPKSQDIGNVGDPSAPYQLPSALPKPSRKAQILDPSIEESGAAKASTLTKESDIAKNYSNGVPSPGKARTADEANRSIIEQQNKSSNTKDIGTLRRNFTSVDRTLESRPETAPIVNHIVSAADAKAQWIATTERDLAAVLGNVGKKEKKLIGEMLDKGVANHPMGNTPLGQKAAQIKTVLDKIHAELGVPADGKLGYIDNYLTHIQKEGGDLGDGVRQIWEFHLKKPFQEIFGGREIPQTGPKGLHDFYDHGLGNPSSPFSKTRTSKLENYELDVSKVLPAYVESIAKLKFDKPAVDAAKKLIAELPEKDIYGAPNKIKELSEWYVKNYTRYDSMPGLAREWNDWTSRLMRTTGRSMLGFSTGLQTLHLARIPANLWPELGTKYTVEGIKQLVKNPKNAYNEAVSLGLLQNEVRPFAFKTPMQKADSILAFFSAADFLDRSIGYHGFKKMFIDKGMNEAEASLKAISASKKASLFVDNARPIKAFQPDPSFGGSLTRLTLQFKQVPIKIIEQYVTIAKNARKDPATAARMVTGVGLAIAGMEAGYRTFHIGPQQIELQTGGAFGSVVRKVYNNLMKGRVKDALKDTALWLTPAGISMERQIRRGPSMFESSHEENRVRMPRP